MRNIILIGFMGTGKTTSGRMLARTLGWNFIDVDRQIEVECNMPVAAIFDQQGEQYFREQEKRLIQNLIGCHHTVIATGGGAIMSDENLRNLQQCGVVVCLTAKPETIVKRLEGDVVIRPLLNCPQRLERVTQLLKERQERYQIADLCIDTEALNPMEVTKAIIKFVEGL